MNDELLHAYFDGELGPEEAARVEAELAANPADAGRLEDLKGLDEALASLPGHDAPAAFTGQILKRARRERRGRVVRLLAPLAVAAAIMLAVVLAQDPTVDPTVPTEMVADTAYTWEGDTETFDSLALTDLEEEILEELEAT